MFDEMFPDDVYDLNNAPRWLIRIVEAGFMIEDAVQGVTLKAVFGSLEAAAEICDLLCEYETTGKCRAGSNGR